MFIFPSFQSNLTHDSGKQKILISRTSLLRLQKIWIHFKEFALLDEWNEKCEPDVYIYLENVYLYKTLTNCSLISS